MMADLSLNKKKMKHLDRRPVASSASVAGISAQFLAVKTSDRRPVLGLPRRRAALFHLSGQSGSLPPPPAILCRSGSALVTTPPRASTVMASSKPAGHPLKPVDLLPELRRRRPPHLNLRC